MVAPSLNIPDHRVDGGPFNGTNGDEDERTRGRVVVTATCRASSVRTTTAAWAVFPPSSAAAGEPSAAAANDGHRLGVVAVGGRTRTATVKAIGDDEGDWVLD